MLPSDNSGFQLKWGKFAVLAVNAAVYLLLLVPFDGVRLYSRFLNPKYWWLVCLAAGIELLALVYVLFRRKIGGHTHNMPPARFFLNCAFLMLPVLYMPAALRTNLGTSALLKRTSENAFEQQVDTSATDQTQELVEAEPEDGIYRPSFKKIMVNEGFYNGKTVELEGMVFKKPGMEKDSFYCFRFVIVCCAADAVPARVKVVSDRAGELEDEQWVRVVGTFDVVFENNRKNVKITADSVEKIPTPKNPYSN